MFFPNYSKPGKGVQKRDPNQSEISVFFDILPRKLWNLVKLNWLYLLTSIPFFAVTVIITGIATSPLINTLSQIVADSELVAALAFIDLVMRLILSVMFVAFWGIAPCATGFTYILRNYGHEEHCWFFSDYFERIKLNIKQSLPLWITDLIVFYLIAVAMNYYISSSLYIMVFALSFATIVYTIMHMYIYQMMITFDLKLTQILKNAFLLTFTVSIRNLLLLLITVGLHIVLPILIILYFQNITAVVAIIILELCLLPALSGFTVNYFISPVLDKYVKKNPDAE